MLHHHPEHISAYSLTIEENTVFGNWQRKGKLQTLDDDHAARQLELLVEILAANGYEQYEVSNFARNGSIAQHNTNYWKQQKYLGIGPSAHSFNGVSRQFNISNNNRYIKSIQSGSIPFTLEVLSREDKINEYLLTTLRTKWGSNLLWLKEELQYSLLEENSKYIEQLMDTKLATYRDHHLILTRKGMMMADRIASDLFVIRS
jgi:oxygen-independent coproporphyrinogen-3 oxidase